MSLGTLYVNHGIRTVAVAALVRHFKLDVKIVDPATCSEFPKMFPLAKFPAFIGPKGVKLTEVIAIAVYCMYYLIVTRIAAFGGFSIPLSQLSVCGHISIMMRSLFILNSYPCLNRSCRDFIL